MKVFLKSFFISCALIVLAIIIYSKFINSQPIAKSKQTQTEYPIVETAKLFPGKHFITIKAYGEVVSDKIINIKYRDKGRIIGIGKNIKAGSYVNKGKLLFEVDSFNLKNKLKEKYSAKKIFLLKLKTLKSQINTAHLKKTEIITQRDIVKKQLDKKTKVDNKVFSENSIDDLRLSLSKREETLINIIELINILKIDVETYTAEIEKLDIIIEKLNYDLKETKVTAPFSGHLSELKIEIGKEVSLNESLAILSDTDNLEVKFFIGGRDYYQLSRFNNKGLGKLINVKWLMGNKYYETKAKINRIDGAVNKEIAGINLYAKIIQSDTKIPLGAFVEIVLIKEITTDVILVPLSSVFDNQYIYIAINNRLIKQKINIVSEELDGILIEDDNLSGKNIVLTRLSDMHDKMRVNISSQ